MLTKENLEERKTGIGASEIAAVVGIEGAFGSPLSVYEAKVAEAIPVEENDAIRWGNRMEPVILGWVAEDTGLLVQPNNRLVRHPEHSFCIATPDGFAFETPAMEADRPVAVVEAKAPSYTGDDWTDPEVDPLGAPSIYLVQAQWQMAATGLPRCILAALVNRRLWIYNVEANADLQAALLEKGAEFWRRVEAHDPPLDDLRAADSGRLSKLLRQTSDALVVVEQSRAAQLLQAAITYQRAGEAIKAAEEVKDQAAAQLKAAIGPNAGIDLGAVKVSFRANKPTPEVNWREIVEEINPPVEVLNRHTVIRSRARPLRVTQKKSKEGQ